MRIAAPYKCDYCGEQKRETNHWWLRNLLVKDAFLLDTWTDLKAATDDYEHICSEACATKALSKWMATQ